MAPKSIQGKVQLNKSDVIQHFAPRFQPIGLYGIKYVSGSTFFLRAQEGVVAVVCQNTMAQHTDGFNSCVLRCPFNVRCHNSHRQCKSSIYAYYIVNRTGNTRIVVAGTDISTFSNRSEWDVSIIKFDKTEFLATVRGIFRED